MLSNDVDDAIQPEMNLKAEDDFSIKIRIIFNSRTYDASGGQGLEVCKDVGQDHFVKFATTFCTEPADSNFSTRRSIVDLLGRLLRT